MPTRPRPHPRQFELNLYGIEIGDTNGIEDGQSTFELNLYGIEIKGRWSGSERSEQFELNLYGIEIIIYL